MLNYSIYKHKRIKMLVQFELITSHYIKLQDPTIRGFTDKNIWMMKQFYETYKDDKKIYTLCREISWSNNRKILSLKTKEENPSIGVLLCREKNDEVVEYALSRSLSPTVISEYKTKLIPKKILQDKMNELYERFDK